MVERHTETVDLLGGDVGDDDDLVHEMCQLELMDRRETCPDPAWRRAESRKWWPAPRSGDEVMDIVCEILRFDAERVTG